VLLALYRAQRRPYLLHWSLSWLALLAALGASLAAEGLSARAPGDPLRLLARSLRSASACLQPVLLLLGAVGLSWRRPLAQRHAWGGLGVVFGLGLLTPLAALLPGARLVFAAAEPALALLAALPLAAAYVVWSGRGAAASIGTPLLCAGLAVHGVERLAARLPAQGAALGTASGWLDLAGTAALWAAGLGMALRALEQQRDEALVTAATLERQAFHDPVTGLPNRQLFFDRLRLAVLQAERDGTRLAVVLVDLDRFKVINDSLGHTRGEELLRAVAQRIQGLVRESDTLARLGGDEFVLLLPRLAQPADAARIAVKLVEGLRLPFGSGSQEQFVTASVGASVFPDDAADAEALVKNADVAMYRAKEHGRDTYQLYDAAMNPRAAERLALENGLRTALGRGQLVLHYQPLVDTASGRIHGSEALLRWQHPERGLLYPRDFMELAELTGVITSIGAWALETACAQTRLWQDAFQPQLFVAVNLSARQFLQPGLAEQVKRGLARSGLEGRFLELEITESLAMQKADATIDTLRELKELGVRISIDDFGTGYSSLSYLKRFPIDTLKIDRTFVSEIHADPGDAAIATTVIAMARSLGLRVVAEGVEREEQVWFLQAHRCDQVQGFLFSRPVAAERFDELLRNGRLGPPMWTGPTAS
jgi:diguanylate cyclase (GGDEF)-like protein